MINYTNLLREHNLKATPQRLAITDILYLNGHVSVELLYEKMLHQFNSISLATIYKNINLMLENSFVQEVKIPNAKSVYELTKETHSHLVCEECASIEDLSIDLKNILTKNKNIASDFKINSVSVIFNGLCKKCILTSKG